MVFALNYEGEDFCQDSPAWPGGTYLGQMHPYHSDFYRGYAERRGWDPCATWATDQRNSAIRGLRELGYTVLEPGAASPSPEPTAMPTATPAGSLQIAFHSDRDGDWEIYVMRADGSDVRQLTDNDARDIFPAWSPGGEQIAFASNRDGDWEIYVMRADGSGVRQLTDNDAGDAYPAWSPDGEQIAFDSNRDGDWEIYVMRADGSDVRQLTDHDAADVFPAWSPVPLASSGPLPGPTATPTPTPTPRPTPTPTPTPETADGVCRVGLIVRPGESCTYPGTSDDFSVDSSGRGHFIFFTAGTGIDARNTTINGVTYNFKASKQSDGTWIIEAAG